jgi:hypothetical protein
MSDYNLDFLFYQSPEEYWYRIDGDTDPKLREVTREEIRFRKYISACPLNEYVVTLTKALKDIYPCHIDYFLKEGKYSLMGNPGKILRENVDVIAVQAEYKQVDDDYEYETYLDSLILEFKKSQPRLRTWVQQGLENKIFTADSGIGITSFSLENSPINKILIEEKKLSFYIDKNSYIRYNR